MKMRMNGSICKKLYKKVTAFALAVIMITSMLGSAVSAEEMLSAEAFQLPTEYVEPDVEIEAVLSEEETDAEPGDLEDFVVDGLVDDGAAVPDDGTVVLEGEGVYPAVDPEDSVRPNCVKVGMKGTYTTESATKILNKLNAIRKEACDNGYKNPATGGKLTSADYVPMKWSSDMEAAARVRAMEASILNGHTRLNNMSCFTVENDLDLASSSGESLAWNWESAGLMYGINQWYDERDAYIGKASGQTGHYQMIINPDNVYVGVACCKAEGSKWESTVAMHTTWDDDTLDQTKDSTIGKQTVEVEVNDKYLKKLTVTGLNSMMAPGATGRFTAGESMSVPDYYHEIRPYSGTLMEATITSSNPAVLSVDAAGNYAVADVAPGSKEVITVTVSAGTKSEAKTVTVCAPDMELLDTSFPYRGAKLQPAVRVFVGDTNLKSGTDYTVTYGDATHDNISAGENGIAIVEGKGNYQGFRASRTFTIEKASAEIRPLDIEMGMNDTVPVYRFAANLQGNDRVDLASAKATCVLEREDGAYKLGKYPIVPKPETIRIIDGDGRDVTANYVLRYANGELTVTKGAGWHEITYVMNGHGSAPASKVYYSAEHGNLLKAYIPSEEGYRFEGWYTDAALTKAFNPKLNVVQEDLTLYAKWSENCVNDLFIYVAPSCTYTGSGIKPQITIYDYQSYYGLDKKLAEKKDYTLQYYNNVNVNTTPVVGRGTGDDFNPELPYVVLTGKGNYSGIQKINFNITPASIGDGENLAAGLALKYYPNLKTTTKAQDAFASLTKSRKALVQNRDVQVVLKTIEAYDEEGNALPADQVIPNHMIPAGYSGAFALELTGMGNYCGSLIRQVRVDDPNRQISASTVTIAKANRKMPYTGMPVTLPINAVTVAIGRNVLAYGTDYTLSYSNNTSVGTATLRVTGVGAYAGYKDCTYQITGTALTSKNLIIPDFPVSRMYTGKPQLVAGLDVYYKDATHEEKLRYGWDYLITYTNNLNVGKVTVTYTGLGKGGYTGVVKKTFKITPMDLSRYENVLYSWPGLYPSYNKRGVRVDESIVLTNQNTGAILTQGKDYTLTYKNIFKVCPNNEASVTIKGKGNYSGAILQPFCIGPRPIYDGAGGAKVIVKPMVYDGKKAPTAVYKPSLQVMVDGYYLKATEYTVKYHNNTQADITEYLERGGPAPQVEIFGKGPYASDFSFGMSAVIPVYKPEYKLTAKNTYVVVEDAYYTGVQVQPKARCYFIDATLAGPALTEIMGDLQGLTDHDEILAAGRGCVRQLIINNPNNPTENWPLNISYGTNITAGTNKGSLTLTPSSGYSYGGSVTVKFNIIKKEIDYRKAE